MSVIPTEIVIWTLTKHGGSVNFGECRIVLRVGLQCFLASQYPFDQHKRLKLSLLAFSGVAIKLFRFLMLVLCFVSAMGQLPSQDILALLEYIHVQLVMYCSHEMQNGLYGLYHRGVGALGLCKL
ncbi:hypothetical protein H5410_003145 [Solanum commersonii]|uniref:Uncharacterized protein n=1 Tax=Solanum commersonii TaxID=4109 RepID=A0A9J6B475_SOLCO|nr:hypothetical protein H5410_003145 [Solanum commersonii]